MSFTALLKLVIVLFVASSAAPARAPTSTISRLSWLAGCWALEGGESGSGETWLPPAGGTMLGVGRTVKNGMTVATEFMQIRENSPGQVVFVATPSGQSEASFNLIKEGSGEVIFANPQHDFPQQIMYRAVGRDKLLARIEGKRDATVRSIDFPMRRANCESLDAKR